MSHGPEKSEKYISSPSQNLPRPVISTKHGRSFVAQRDLSIFSTIPELLKGQVCPKMRNCYNRLTCTFVGDKVNFSGKKLRKIRSKTLVDKNAR